MGKNDILIVEDDPSTYQALPALLSTYGYTTKLVNNLSDALVEIKKEPSFLLLDLIIPGGDGIEVLKYMKENNLKTKCAITTGYLEDGLEVLGCPVLMKPIDFDALLEFLNK